MSFITIYILNNLKPVLFGKISQSYLVNIIHKHLNNIERWAFTINTFSFLNLKLLQTKFYNVHSLLLCLTLNLTFNQLDKFKININSVLYAFIQRNTETKSNKKKKLY